MATYLPGVTDAVPDIPLFSPNMDFYNQMLTRRQSQYEQGIRSIASNYSQFQGELSDPVNVERRAKFLKEADEQLKNISTADFAIQQNVDAANAIYDPLVKDSAVVFDMYHTRRIRKELSTMEAWDKSDDPKIRSKFNKNMYDWVRRDLDALRKGNGNVENYKVKNRYATAFMDPQEIINNAIKETGAKFEKDVFGNEYIVTVTDGKEYYENYKLFADQVLKSNPQYTKQLSILAENEKETIIERGRMDPRNANASDDELIKSQVLNSFDKNQKRQKEYIEELDNDLEEQRAQSRVELQKHSEEILANPNGSKASEFAQRKSQVEQMETMIESYRKKYNEKYGGDLVGDGNTVRQKYAENAVKDPIAHFMDLYQTNDAMSFANIRSAVPGKRSVKKNDAYFSSLEARDRAMKTMADIEKDKKDLEIRQGQLAVSQQNADTNRIKGLQGDKTSETIDPETGLAIDDGTTTSSKKSKGPDIQYLSDGVTNVTVSEALSQLKGKIDGASMSALSNMTGTFGGLYLLSRMGVDDGDIGKVRQYMSKKFANEGTSVPATNDELAALKSVYKAVFSFSKESKNDELTNIMREKLLKKENTIDIDFGDIMRLAAKNYVAKDNNDMLAISNIKDYEKQINTVKYLSTVYNKAQEVTLAFIGNTPEYQSITKTEKDASGKLTKRMINEDDLVKVFGDASITLPNSSIYKLNDEEKNALAKAYFTGDLKVKTFSDKPNVYSMDTYQPSAVGLKTQVTFNGAEYIFDGMLFGAVVPNKLPTPQEYRSLRSKVNEQMPIVLLPDVARGAVSSNPIYVLNNDLKTHMLDILSVGNTLASSNIKVSTGGGYDDYKDADDQQTIRAELKSNKNVQVALQTASSLNNGGQVVQVTFPSSDKEQPSPTAGKTYYFPIIPNSKNPQTLQIFESVQEADEFYPYKKEGKAYELDHFKGSGITAKMIPDAPNSNVGRIIVSIKEYDPKTNTYSETEKKVEEQPYNLGMNSFQEIKADIFRFHMYPYMKQKIRSNEIAETSKKTTTSTPENDAANKFMSELNESFKSKR